MSTATSPAAKERAVSAAFRHDALLYAGDEQFVTATAAFVRDGLERDEPTLIAVIEPRATLLREELGRDAESGNVEFIDMWTIGRNPGRIIPAWQDWVDRNQGSGRNFRGIGEPIWAARSPAELVECQWHEQLLNVAFDGGTAWWLICPYDTESLSDDVITRAHGSHQEALSAAHGTAPAVTGLAKTALAQTTATRSHRNSPAHPYAHPHARQHSETAHSATLTEPLPDPAPADILYQATFGRDDLPVLRHEITARAHVLGLGPERTADLILVVAELAANSVVHGGGRGTLRLWRENSPRAADTACEVRDAGLVTDPLVGRRRPALAEGKGAGLWIANQLCDLVQIRSAPDSGTIVRVHFTEPHI